VTTALTALLTHENPDMDAALSVWLLKRFGEQKYPGVQKLPVLFLPAGTTPDALHPDDLEQQKGILAVDTGGGRLDTHARDGVFDESKRQKCASTLVAEDLDVSTRPDLKKILEFVTLQETRGRSIASSHPMDHLISLPNLVRGLNHLYPEDPGNVVEVLITLYDAAYATERHWFQALEDYKSATVTRLKNRARLSAVFSDTSAAVKVARLKRADLVIHRNSPGHTGITARNNGVLAKLHMEILAEVIRIAEAIIAQEPIEYDRLRQLGIIHGWYLHDSGRILSKGSPKNKQIPPSKLDLNEVLQLCAARLDETQPMPPRFCALARSPEAQCDGCPFQRMDLASCAHLRQKAQITTSGS